MHGLHGVQCQWQMTTNSVSALQTSSQSRTDWLPVAPVNQACKEATSLYLSSELLYLPLFLLGLLLLHLQPIGHTVGLSAHLLNEAPHFIILLPA